jgi:hypothetical protein
MVRLEKRLENSRVEDVLVLLEDMTETLLGQELPPQMNGLWKRHPELQANELWERHSTLRKATRRDNQLIIQAWNFFSRRPDGAIQDDGYTDAFVFTCHQIQSDVRLRIDYGEAWQIVADGIWGELDRLYPKSFPAQPKAEPADSERTGAKDIRIAKRQVKVLDLSEKGNSIKSIASLCGVSAKTVVNDRKVLGISEPHKKKKAKNVQVS